LRFWETTAFKELQKEWYAKLKDAGFDDAEKNTGENEVIKQYAVNAYSNQSDIRISAKQDYFSILRQNVESQAFDRAMDKIIMCMIADGKRIRDIQDALQMIGEYRCRNAITLIIRRYEMRWGIKTYTDKQMNKYGGK
jgi:hypothetical protein